RRDAIGARIDLSEHAKLSGVDDVLTLLFSETPSRIILSVKPENVAAVRAIAEQAGAPCAAIGETSGSKLSFMQSRQPSFEVQVPILEEAWRNALPSHLDRPLQTAED